MCTVDIGVLGSRWVNGSDGYPFSFPDFETSHVCRNYEEIRVWAKENKIRPSKDLPDDYLELPEDEVEILDLPL
jgi:hypothetical protein